MFTHKNPANEPIPDPENPAEEARRPKKKRREKSGSQIAPRYLLFSSQQ